jgi:hypothetical protein
MESGESNLFELEAVMKKISLLLIVGMFLLIPATGCYAKGPWKGKIIDSETKQPLEGAAVVAVWYKAYAGPAGTTDVFLDASEAVTNKDGEFEITSKSFLSVPLVRDVKGPFFTMFKPGYGSYPEFQVNIKAPNLTAMEYFQTKGAVVELPKLKTRKERLDTLDSIHLFNPGGKTPNLMRLYNMERKSLGFSE